jgi:hypothetical protein
MKSVVSVLMAAFLQCLATVRDAVFRVATANEISDIRRPKSQELAKLDRGIRGALRLACL